MWSRREVPCPSAEATRSSGRFCRSVGIMDGAFGSGNGAHRPWRMVKATSHSVLESIRLGEPLYCSIVITISLDFLVIALLHRPKCYNAPSPPGFPPRPRTSYPGPVQARRDLHWQPDSSAPFAVTFGSQLAEGNLISERTSLRGILQYHTIIISQYEDEHRLQSKQAQEIPRQTRYPPHIEIPGHHP